MKKYKAYEVRDMLFDIDDELFNLALQASLDGNKERFRALADAAEVVKEIRRKHV